MARGFHATVSVSAADEITEELLRAQIATGGLLTELESATFLPGVIAAAQTLIGLLPSGPYLVAFDGEDHTRESGQVSIVRVAVTTPFTNTEPLPPTPQPDAASVPPVNTPPLSFTSAPEFSGETGTAFTFEVTTERATTSPIPTIAASNVPDGVTFVDNANGTGTFSADGTEAAATATITLTATTDVETATQAFDLTIIEPSTAGETLGEGGTPDVPPAI